MKTFETPYVDVKKFDVMDVLTASSGGFDCPDDCPDDEPPPIGGMEGQFCF